MNTLAMQLGSSAANGRDEVVFLIAPINTIGDIDRNHAEWVRGIHAYEALDIAQIDMGNCMIVKSCLASDYDAFCIANRIKDKTS